MVAFVYVSVYARFVLAAFFCYRLAMTGGVLLGLGWGLVYAVIERLLVQLMTYCLVIPASVQSWFESKRTTGLINAVLRRLQTK